MITWGIVLACHCAVTNKSGLYAARFFLGLVGHHSYPSCQECTDTGQAEAGQFPGVILQMCYWYRPDEMSLVSVIHNFTLPNPFVGSEHANGLRTWNDLQASPEIIL